MGQALSDRVAGQFSQIFFRTVWLLIRAFEEAYVSLIRFVLKKLHYVAYIAVVVLAGWSVVEPVEEQGDAPVEWRAGRIGGTAPPWI